MKSLAVVVALVVGIAAGPSTAQPAVQLERVHRDVSLSRPLAVHVVPGDDSKLYVVEQVGRITILDRDPAATAPRVFGDIRQRVESGPNEAGLLGLAFHPDFARNRQVILSYTRPGTPLVSVVSRFLVGANGLLDPASEQVLLSLAQPYANHNGGDVLFGPDGFLYVSFGDGGSAGDPLDAGQDRNTLLGKILRLDVDRGSPYAIPADNPFARGGGRPEIFAYGLRNVWRMTFDRATGELWAADVGQNRLEEVDIIVKGGNYGWNIKEGTSEFRPRGRSFEGLIDPVAEYGRNDGCSVTGGYVYRGREIPALVGMYVFGDYCSGKIWAVAREGGRYRTLPLTQAGIRISSFGEANDGELYVVDHGGALYRLRPRR
ncbi:MAG: PQQ-dependent sugar dehydrogenase [Alphaproteobacteria bacterium]|nr:PQQ-dependent sugar dehydrogenase [Alphaproteobacteria bacterium]